MQGMGRRFWQVGSTRSVIMRAMPTLQILRRSSLIARFLLACWLLSIGVAIASPLVKPQALELICSGAGVMKLLPKTDDGKQQAVSHALDCPLCAASGAPPPQVRPALALTPALAYELRSRFSSQPASRTGAPPPARGPPAFS